MINFAENFTSSSIPAVDIEMQSINSASPSSGLHSLQSAVYLAIVSWLTVHLHIFLINFWFCYELFLKSIIVLFILQSLFYINNRTIASYLVSYPII